MHRHPSHCPGHGSSSTPRYAKPNETKPKQGNEAPGGAKVWPRHADGCCHPLALRARRAPQNVPLRGSPASGALRLPALHRDPPPRLSTAVALRTAPAPPDRSQRPASCKRARRSPKAPLDGASQGQTKLGLRFFPSPWRAHVFFGVPQQNDGGRRCRGAPSGVHSGMILWRGVECELRAWEIGRVITTAAS